MVTITTEEEINKLASQAASSVSELILFGRALHKVKLGATGGRVTLKQEECQALIWGVQLLREKE